MEQLELSYFASGRIIGTTALALPTKTVIRQLYSYVYVWMYTLYIVYKIYVYTHVRVYLCMYSFTQRHIQTDS